MTFRIGIELGLTGGNQVKEGLKEIGGAAKGLADEFSKGLKTGMEDAVKDVRKPLSDVNKQVDASAAAIKQSAGGIGQSLRDGIVLGMEQAVREMNRPMEELKAMANQAAKALDIRPDWKIQEEIDKTRKAYDDLKASGLATSGELTRAKQAMKDKVGELRQEMGKWSGDWDDLAKKLDNYGSKLQALGAKAMIAGAPAILAGKTSIETEHTLAGIANTSGIDPARVEQTVAAWKAKIAELSVFTNQKQTELVEAMGVMVSRGLDPEKALAMLGPIGNAATATGGKISDIARTLYATYDNLKVPIDESAKTLDVLATAGNRGAFELKDMAQHLPSLTAIAGSLKMVGIESTAQIAAAAQIAMKGAGDASQAANNLQNFLLKLSAPDTMKAFKDAGINLSAEIRKGLDSGDLIGHIAGVVQQATNGDAEKISTLFRDAQVKQFITPMLANIDEYKAIRDQALAAIGTIDKQKAVMEQTTAEKFKGIGNSFDAAIEKSSLFQGVLDKIKGTADWFAANPGVFEPIATVVTALAVGGAGLAAAGVALPAIATGITAIAAAGPALVAAAPAIATVLGAVAAWKVGDAVGTWLAGQIDEMVRAVTGDKAATLGTALYDLMEGPNGVVTWANKVAASGGAWAVAGRALMDGLRSGIAAGLKGALGIGEKLAEGVAYIKGTAAQWLQAGRDIIQGLIDGVAAKAKEVVDKVRGLGKEVVREFKDLLGIKSPSRVFMAIGEEIGAGLVIGIADSEDAVRAAVEGLGDAAIYAGDAATLRFIREQEQAVRELRAEMVGLGATAQATAGKARDWFGRFLPDDAAGQLAAMGERASADIGQSLSNALMNGFKKGKDYGRELADAIRGTFANLVLRPLIQPVTASIAGAASGVLSAFMPSAASASTGAAGSSFLGSIASTLGGAITGGIGEVVGGIASAFGASNGVATGLGAFASSAVPVLGAIALMASMFGRKPSGKSAWGEVDLSTGATFGVGSQTDDKYSAENNQAVAAMSKAAAEYAALLRSMGATVTGSHRFSASDRFGYGMDVYAEGQGYTSTDREAFLRRLFDTLIDEADGLDATLGRLLRTFEGTGEAAAQYAAALGDVAKYQRADLMGDALEQIRQVSRSAWQAWSDAGAATRTALAGFDGSLAKAQALGSATAAMYQSELAVVGQIQGLLASTSAAFGDSIRSIEMSVLDSAGRYDYLRAEIDAAYASLGAAADPQVIGDLASQINRLTMEAYGLLDGEQKADVADEYTAYLREVNTLTSERLNAAQDRVEGQHAEMVAAIEDAMSRVAARMEAAAAAQQAAAATPVQVASTIRVDFSADIPGNAEVGYGQG